MSAVMHFVCFLGECRDKGDLGHPRYSFCKIINAISVRAPVCRWGSLGSLEDLLRRVPIPEKDGTLLIKAGALDLLEPGMSRPQILWTFLAHVRSHSTVVQKVGSTGHLFAFHGTDCPVPPFKDCDSKTQLCQEAEALGFLISTHPLTLYSSRLRGLRHIQANDMADHIGEEVTMVGWCTASRTVITSSSP